MSNAEGGKDEHSIKRRETKRKSQLPEAKFPGIFGL